MWVLQLLGIAVFGISVIAAVCNSIFIQILFDEVDKLKEGSEKK